MQHFLGQALGQGFHHGDRVVAPGQEFAGAGQFGFAPSIGLVLQLLDQRHGATLAHPIHEALHARIDDDLGFGHRRLSVGLAGLHHAGQVVHGVQVHVFE